ncbi:hypothetical protein KFK09_020998 [Dendrobium nobile]|uniref:Uncharacterized protein n=1 Tax=Dendrobium nobile TaxID=94219 RepID=A0A8T3AN76_DENNO|nr:hypothetical protein KFK09_020998 [Dendrobium nobile]
MAGELVNRGRSQRLSSRLIPKRGKVKVMIAVGLVHTCAAFFSRAGPPVAFRAAQWWRRLQNQHL